MPDEPSIRYVTAAEAVSHIPRGARIFLGSGAAVPISLVQQMADAPQKFIDHEVVSILTLQGAPFADPKNSPSFRHNALFIGPNVRAAVEDGHADYTPVFLSEIPRLFKSRQMPLQAALIQVAPPKNGLCNLGVSVDIVKAAAESAELVIAEVNPRMPRISGDADIPVERIDYFVHCEHELPELAATDSTVEAESIGQYICELVSDGDTIQIGIGAIPNAVVSMLQGKRDLGVHTEMLGDGFAELAARGVITNARKSLDRGKTVASFIMGTERVYDFVRRNPHAIGLYPSDYVNDPMIIGQIDRLVAINTALQIDLTGQVCSDSLGERFYSGIGGQVDFIRGAARSQGGKPIIALPSTAEDGVVSRIVPRLDAGAGVVTTRGDVHYVVTEYGVAYLHGKTVRQRAMALIEIAHPKFRPYLLAEAKHRRLVYADQIEPPVTAAVYPRRFESRVTDKTGTALLLRPVRPSDETRLHELYYAMSDESLYKRFFQLRKAMPHESLQKLCNVDYEREMSIVACTGGPESETIAGAASYTLSPTGTTADVAFVVDDRMQGRGIGRLLLTHILEIARRKGVEALTADVLATNAAMKHLFESVGGTQKGRTTDGISTYSIPVHTERP